MNLYKSKKTAFNGLAMKMQDFIKIPKSTATYHYNMDKEFNKIFCNFLKLIGEPSSKNVTQNAITISERFYTQFVEWFKYSHQQYQP